MKKLLILIFVIISFYSYSQEYLQIKDFGNYIYSSVKNNDNTQIANRIPTKEELFTYMSLFSADNETKQDFVKEINNSYSSDKEKIVASLSKVRNECIELGVNWEKTKYETTVIKEFPKFNENKIGSYDIVIKFSYYSVIYSITTKLIILGDNIYVVDKIRLE